MVLIQYYLYSESDVKQAINNIYNKLDDIKKISLSQYGKIVSYLILLKYDIGLEIDDYDKITEKIIKNIKKSDPSDLEFFYCSVEISEPAGKKEFEKIRNKVLNELNTSYVDFEKNLEGYRKYIDKTLKLGDKIKTINVNYILNKISLNDMKEHLPEFTPQELDRIRCILGRLDFTSINEENYNAVKDFQEHIQMMIKNNIVSDKIQIYQLKLFDKMISRKFERIHMN